MLENICCAAVAVFFVIGFVFCVWLLLTRLACAEKGTSAVILWIRRGNECAAARVELALSLRRLTGDRQAVVAVCAADDAATRDRLAAAFGDERRFYLCSPAELPALLSAVGA